MELADGTLDAAVMSDPLIRATVEQCGTGLVWVGADGVIVSANPCFVRWAGRPARGSAGHGVGPGTGLVGRPLLSVLDLGGWEWPSVWASLYDEGALPRRDHPRAARRAGAGGSALAVADRIFRTHRLLPDAGV